MTLFLSFRYSFSSAPRHRGQVARIILSTALSLAVTLLVMSLMSFLQEGRIDRIKAVQSFDITVEGDHEEELEALFPDASVFLYKEEEALAGGRAVTVRYIGGDYDGGLRLLSGDLSSLAVPYSLWFRLEDGKASLTSLREGRSGARLPRTDEYKVSGIYSTALGRSFDDSHVFLPLGEDMDGVQTALKGAGEGTAGLLRDSGYEVTEWKERESGLYAAFMLEKTMMLIVLCFLFVIILVSMKSSVRLFYSSKRRERAELEVLGLGRGRISLVFLLSFLIVLAAAIASGVLLFFVLRPLAEALTGRFLYYQVSLAFPSGLFALLSLSLCLVTALLCLWYRAKEGRHSLMEVLSDASPSA